MKPQRGYCAPFRCSARSPSAVRAASILAAAALLPGLSASAAAHGTFGALHDRGEDEHRVSWIEEGEAVLVAWKGDVRFSEDWRRVEEISRRGYLKLEWIKSGEARRVEIRRRASGLQFVSTVANVEAVSLHPPAWLPAVLPRAVDRTAVGVAGRARRLLAEEPFEEVLAAGAALQTDYAKSVFFQAILEPPELGPTELSRLMAEVARQVAGDEMPYAVLEGALDAYPHAAANPLLRVLPSLPSDPYKRAFLRRLAPAVADGHADLSTYLAATDSLDAERSRQRTVQRLLAEDRLTDAQLQRLLGFVRRSLTTPGMRDPLVHRIESRLQSSPR